MIKEFRYAYFVFYAEPFRNSGVPQALNGAAVSVDLDEDSQALE
ncbi:hypothetical protein N8Z80_08110 [Litorivicinus sp.]|nr:hypothetical protein [Litorivicinus sp.]